VPTDLEPCTDISRNKKKIEEALVYTGGGNVYKLIQLLTGTTVALYLCIDFHYSMF